MKKYKTLKELRIEKGLTQSQTAPLFELALSTYQQKEQGYLKWTLSDMVRAKRIYGIKLDELKEIDDMYSEL